MSRAFGSRGNEHDGFDEHGETIGKIHQLGRCHNFVADCPNPGGRRLPTMHERTVVLLAEDDVLVRMATAQAFDVAGLDVVEAGHAADALAFLRSHARRTHMLFTDIHMPGEMDGLHLAHHARQHWPWIGLLVTSGTRPVRELPETARFLIKPYQHDTAIGHVRELRGTLPPS